MIRFACPTCKAILDVPDNQAGASVPCSRCGQRLRVPPAGAEKQAAPASPAGKPAPAVSWLAPGSNSGSAPSPPAAAQKPEPVVRAWCPACGKKIKAQGPVADKRVMCPRCKQKLAFSPDGRQLSLALEFPAEAARKASRRLRRRAFTPYLYATLAIALGTLALPLALHVTSYLVAVAMAGAGATAGVLGLLLSLTRRGAGFGLSTVALAVCGSTLYVAVQLAGGSAAVVRDVRDRITRPGAPAPEAGDDVPDDDSPPVVPDKPPGKGNQDNGVSPRGHRASKRPQPPKNGAPDLDTLIKRLQRGEEKERIEAAERLAKFGAAAMPAARALCAAATDPSEAVRRSALAALEKAHPALYQPVMTLLVDENPFNHITASQAVGALDEEGRPAVPILLYHIAVASKRPGTLYLIEADARALARVAPDDEQVLNKLLELATPKFSENGFQVVSQAAAEALREVGDSQPQRRKRITVTLASLVDKTDRMPGWSSVRLVAIQALESFGPDAAAAVPALKKAKLSPDMAIRDAATRALDRIEKHE